MNRTMSYGWGMVAASAVAVVTTWQRAAWVGTIKVDDVALSTVHRCLVGGGIGGALALAGWCYWRALHAADSISLKSLLPLTLLIHGVAACALPCTSNDVFSNLAYARMLAEGLDPYLAGPSALGAADPFAHFVGAVWWHRPMVYGPVWAGVLRLMGAVRDPWAALWVFKGLCWLAACGVVALTYRYCAQLPDAVTRMQRFILVVWNPALLWEVTAQAHNDGVMALAVLGGLVAATRGRHALAIACFGLACGVKTVMLPLLGLYGWWRLRARDWRTMLGLGAGVIGAGLALRWWGAGAHAWLAAQDVMWSDRAYVAFSWPHSLHLLTLPCGVGAQSMIHALAVAAQWCGTLLLAAYCVCRTRSFPEVVHNTLLFLMLSLLLLLPWFQHWYVVWLLPLALMVPRWELARVVAAASVLAMLQYASILLLPRAVPVVVSVLTLNGVMVWWLWRARA